MLIKHVTALDEFAKLESPWNDLLSQSQNPTVFQTWDWAFTWWNHFNHRNNLWIILAYDQNSNLLGIAPLYTTEKRFGLLTLKTVEFLGYGRNKTSEYLDFVLHKDHAEQITHLFLYHLLANKKKWDVLHLTNIPDNTSTLDTISSYFQSYNNQLHISENLPCPYINLPSTMEEYLLTFKSKSRGTLKNQRNRLLKNYNVDINCCNDLSTLHNNIDDLFELHYKRFGAKSVFYSEINKSFIKEASYLLLKKNILRLYFMKIDGELACAQYGFHYNDTFLLYQTGYDTKWLKQRALKILTFHLIEYATNDNVRIIDFGRGLENYKLEWCKNIRETKDILIFRTKFLKQIFISQKMIYKSIKNNITRTLRSTSH